MRFLISLLAASVVFGADTRQLFNGRDLTGWEMVGPGRFLVENGLLKTEGGMGLLYYTGQKFGNQTIRVVFKTDNEHGNSGVFIRMPDPPKDAWYGVHNGYEVQIDSAGDDWHCTGAIYSLSKATKRTQKPTGQWNTMEVQLIGDKTIVSLNGEKVNEFVVGQPVPERKQWFEPIRGPRPNIGYIGLQNHDEGSTVYFKEVSVSPADGPGAYSKQDRDYAMSYMHAVRKEFLDMVSGLSEEQWTYRASPDRWSIAEIAEHIAVTEDGLFQYATSALKNPPSASPANKIDDKTVIARMTDRSHKVQAPEPFKPTGRWKTHDEIVQHFLESRDRNIAFLKTAENLRGFMVQSPMGTLDAYQAFLMIPAHTERHLAQMAEVKAAPGFPKH